MELEAADVVAANPFDLAGRTLLFAPDGRGGYARAVGSLDWDFEDRGERPARPAEIDLKHFEFEFSGRKWRSLFLSRSGLITFGRAFPEGTPARFGTMEMIAEAMVATPTISALYKPYLGGNIYVSDLPDRVVITHYAWDYEMAVYGRRPKETFGYQVVLHSDGRVAFNYGPDPADADEAFRVGIVGLFPTDPTTGEPSWTPDRVADLSRPDSRFSAAQTEVFRYPAIRDRGEGVADVSCRIIEVLGDEFDFFAFNSQSRVDQQEHGPAHGFGGWYPGNQTATGLGREPEPHRVTPCESRLTNSWGFPVWMKARTVVNEGYASDGHHSPYDEGLTYFAHEIGHTWLAAASYLAYGERIPMQQTHGASHWTFALHAPAPFPWGSTENGSVLGGAYWRENSDGTFSPTEGWWTRAGGFSWLDLYLMGLATAEEVPDMFILRNLQQVTSDPAGPYTGEKEIVAMDQIIAAIGPRDPPPDRARKAFNVGFVYFLLPGETPDAGLLREHANYRDRALDHWDHITGGRGQLTTELPATSRLGVPTGVATEPFLDLDRAGVHRSAVQSLAAQGVFDGTECGPQEFCPTNAVERWVMAVWLVRILDGADPPPVRSSRFADVDGSLWWAPYVERLADLGVTGGCATKPARFCPTEAVSRAQMATFLVRAFGLPPAPPAGFDDVSGGVHAADIDALAASGVTSGCRTQPLRYCPRRDTTRAEMATFLTRAVALDSQISVEPLGGPPRRLGLHRFYGKYLDAGGMPIVSGSAVPDEALYAARAIFGEMLSDRPDLSAAMAELGVRVVIMARSTVRSDLPEFPTDSFWDARTRGGGFFADPMVVIAEENLLCYDDDVFPYEDINIHEFAHALHIVGLEKRQADSIFGRRLNTAYQKAIADGLWKHTYAGTNALEYWAEGVQSWFGLNDPPGPIHNDINTRDELEAYDPNLAALLGEVFGEASVSSSCHETFTDDQTTTVVQGAVSGPDGEGIEGILIWLWQGTRENSGWGWTDSEGVFTIRVPDGSYRLDVYAAPKGTCAGWYDGDGLTTTRSEARPVAVEGTDITDIRIRLPAPPEDLPTITC